MILTLTLLDMDSNNRRQLKMHLFVFGYMVGANVCMYVCLCAPAPYCLCDPAPYCVSFPLFVFKTVVCSCGRKRVTSSPIVCAYSESRFPYIYKLL